MFSLPLVGLVTLEFFLFFSFTLFLDPRMVDVVEDKTGLLAWTGLFVVDTLGPVLVRVVFLCGAVDAE